MFHLRVLTWAYLSLTKTISNITLGKLKLHITKASAEYISKFKRVSKVIGSIFKYLLKSKQMKLYKIMFKVFILPWFTGLPHILKKFSI